MKPPVPCFPSSPTRRVAGRTVVVLALGVASLLGLTRALVAADTVVVPPLVNYQGRLETLNAAKGYTNGLYDIEFRVWDQPNGGSLLWGERYSVYVNNGRFNAVLGSGGAPLTGANPAFNSLVEALRIRSDTPNRERHFGITVLQDENHTPLASPTESFPRQQLLTAGYAVQAQYAQYAEQSQTNFVANNGLRVQGALTRLDQGLLVGGAVAELQSGLRVSGTNATFASGLKVTGGSSELQTGVTVSGGKGKLMNGLEVTGGSTLSGGTTLAGGATLSGGASLSGDSAVTGNFTVTNGLLRLDAGTARGLEFPQNPWGGVDDRAWLTYSRPGSSGENGVLSLGIANDPSDDLELRASGTIVLTGTVKAFGPVQDQGNKLNTMVQAPTDGFLIIHAYKVGLNYEIYDAAGTSIMGNDIICDVSSGNPMAVITIPVAKGEQYRVKKTNDGQSGHVWWFKWRPMGR